MQLRIWAAATIFLGSYLPLSLILLAQDFDYAYLGSGLCIDFWSEKSKCALPFGHPKLSISIFLLCFFCLLFTLFALRAVKPKHFASIKSQKHIPAELMNYTLPYVVSFMGVSYNENGKFVGILIFLGWMFWISYRSGQIILNPVLTAFGWRLYEIEYTDRSANQKTHKTSALVNGELDTSKSAKYSCIQDVMIIRATSSEKEGTE